MPVSMETKKIWMDGKFVNWPDAKVHVMTHAIHYGTGIFEGIRCYPTQHGGALFRLRDHIKRFFASAAALSMKFEFSMRDIENAVLDSVRENGEMDAYVRPFAFYGYGRIGPNPRGAKTHVLIMVVSLKEYLGKKVIHVKTPPFQRIQSRALVPGTKISGSYFNAALASMWANQNGADEALMLDSAGYVAEGAAENLFVVKNGKIFTPQSSDILKGITRDTLIKTSRENGFKIHEKRIKLSDLYKADEAFFTGTAVEVHAIGKVNGKKIGSGKKGPITETIQRFYQKLVRGEIPKYHKWLSEV